MTDAQIKAAVRERDGFRCTECGLSNDEHRKVFGRQLDVHRVTPGSPYRLDKSCQTLCRRCHSPKPKSEYGSRPFVRLPVELMNDVRLTVAALGEPALSYVQRVLQEALRRDLPRAGKIIAKRVAEQGGKEVDE